MKVLIYLFSSILMVLSFDLISTFGIPECHQQDDLDILWPCSDDVTKYYQCVDIHHHVKMPCGSKTWFDFHAQKCVKPSDWKPFFDTTLKNTKATTNNHNEEIITKRKPELKTTFEKEHEIEDEDETENITKSYKTPPTAHRKVTTSYDGPPTITRTSKATRKPYPTPSTPIPTAETEIENKSRNITKRKPIPTNKTRRPRPRFPTSAVTDEVTEDKDKTEKDIKEIVKRRKTKIIPTRAKRS